MLITQPMMDPMLGGYLDGKQFSLSATPTINNGNLLKRNASESFNVSRDM